MGTLTAIVLGCLFAIAAATLVHKTVRTRLLDERCDAICGALSKRAAAVHERSSFGDKVLLLFEKAGLSTISHLSRAYVTLIPLLLVGVVVTAGWLWAFFAAVMLASGQFIIMKWRKKQRLRELSDRLPTFLERVRRLVTIGKTLPHAFVEAAADAEPAIRREIDPFIRRIRHGAPFPDAMDLLAQQNNLIEFYMLAAYARANARFGGRVAHTLSTLIEQLHNRRRLNREIHAATSETRVSAIILVGLTVLIAAVMGINNPDYLAFFFSSNRARLILGLLIAWPCIGVLVMKRILTLDF